MSNQLTEDRIIRLIGKYGEGKLSEEEVADLFHWFDTTDLDTFHSFLERSSAIRPPGTYPSQDELVQQLKARLDREPKHRDADGSPAPVLRRIPVFIRWAIAAAVFALIVTGAYQWLAQTGKSLQTPVKVAQQKDVAPGKTGAVLTLADGSSITLDTLGNGMISAQGNAKLVLEDGQLNYTKAYDKNVASYFNTISTPRGREFRLRLTDGTVVWLNAASSIRYPAEFTGDKRQVEVSGEAYFEVAENTRQPFLVSFGSPGSDHPEGSVVVLGTHFNISTYPDDRQTTTTLLEGAVRVLSAAGEVVLKPGQQSEVTATKIKLNNNVDLRNVMAWKDGIFSFDGRSFGEIMRLLSRWYDIDVVYEDGIPDIGFGGRMERDLNLSRVLTFLQESGVRFRLEEGGKRLVVTK